MNPNFCSNCGNKIYDGDNYCRECGHKILLIKKQEQDDESLITEAANEIYNYCADEHAIFFRAKIEVFMGNFDKKKIHYCIKKYILTELDYNTSGDRGIGRIYDIIPRFAARYRKTIKNMEGYKTKSLEKQLYKLIYIGYLGRVLFFEEEPFTDANINNVEELFELWIPAIYSTNIQKSADLLEVLFNYGYKTIDEIYILLNESNRDTNNVFEDQILISIFAYYFIAGFGLREMEHYDTSY